MFETKLLQEKIRLMREFEAEPSFHRIKGLFTSNIKVDKVVETFQKEYDPTFTFEGTPQALYKKIHEWISINIA